MKKHTRLSLKKPVRILNTKPAPRKPSVHTPLIFCKTNGMIVNKSFNQKDALTMLSYIDGSISQVHPIRYKGSHEKMRNLPPVAREQLIETLCPLEGYDQAMLAGKHIPYRLLSENILTRRRGYDSKAFIRRKKLKLKTI